jgi:hypothetical protein
MAVGLTAALAASATTAFADREEEIRLNTVAAEYAKQLIESGSIVNDKQGQWKEHKPPLEAENRFVRDRGFEQYANWHLGIDERHGRNTKARYKFIFGDFRTLHRCALLAVKSRAHQYGYYAIETAAVQLLQLLEQTKHQPAQLLKNASISTGKSSL